MSKIVTLKIDQDLLDEIRELTQNKYPLRKISSYAEATREALIDFIKKNQKFKNKQIGSEKSQNREGKIKI